MLAKKPYIVPIPGSGKIARIRENGGAADITLSKEEAEKIDAGLDAMGDLQVFGGSAVKK